MDPILIDELVLRPIRLDEAPLVVDAVHETADQLRRWMIWYKPDYGLDHARDWIQVCTDRLADGSGFELGIFDSDGTTFLGGAGLNCFHRLDNMCNLGYWVRRSAHRRGVATRAARALVDHGLGALGFTRIEIVVAQGNEPSMAVARKLGAQFEGTLRNRLVIGGRPVPAAMFSLVPPTRG